MIRASQIGLLPCFSLPLLFAAPQITESQHGDNQHGEAGLDELRPAARSLESDRDAAGARPRRAALRRAAGPALAERETGHARNRSREAGQDDPAGTRPVRRVIVSGGVKEPEVKSRSHSSAQDLLDRMRRDADIEDREMQVRSHVRRMVVRNGEVIVDEEFRDGKPVHGGRQAQAPLAEVRGPRGREGLRLPGFPEHGGGAPAAEESRSHYRRMVVRNGEVVVDEEEVDGVPVQPGPRRGGGQGFGGRQWDDREIERLLDRLQVTESEHMERVRTAIRSAKEWGRDGGSKPFPSVDTRPDLRRGKPDTSPFVRRTAPGKAGKSDRNRR